MHDVFLDIETIPSQRPECRDELGAEIAAEKAALSPPANYKDPAKIEAWLADRAAELDAKADERWRRTALDGARGEVACISWAVDDAPVEHVYREPNGCERELLREFFGNLLAALPGEGARWVGHNVKDFDLRFLFQRCVINRVEPPIRLPHDARGNGRDLYDTMLAWAGWGNRVSLDALCRALGIPTKGTGLDGEAIDGSKVWDFVAAGRIEAVAAYCDADVERVRGVFRSMTFANYSVAATATGIFGG